MSARTYRCPSCGADVDEQARKCAYCRAPVATVRCACCFHMNVPEALHCSGCGRELGLEPIEEPVEPGAALACPECKAPLHAFQVGEGTLHDCETCGGQLVEHPMLRELLQRHERFGVVGPPRKARPTDLRVHYVPCPVCHALMNRKNFGGASGVIVDVCKKHGTWFDAGELPQVLAFAESGGLELERRRREEEAAQHLREQRAAASAPPSHAFRAAEPAPILGSDLAAMVVHFLLS